MPTTADPAEKIDEDDADEAPTPVPFRSLSPKAQERAVEKARYDDVDGCFDWWDDVYEDANRMATLLGIQIDTHDKKNGGGPKIHFSGFCSQGDGASFTGWYRFKDDALAAIQSETNDETLIDLANRLTALNVMLALYPGFEHLQVRITTRGFYSHSNSMDLSIDWEPPGVECEDAFPFEHFEDEIQSCMRGFADWIYEQLEAEHENLISDERVRERLSESDDLFDRGGDMI